MTLREKSLRAAGLSTDLAQKFAGSEAAANAMAVRDIVNVGQKMAVKKAFSWSLRNMWILYTVLAAIAVGAGLFVERRKLSREHTETVTGIKEKSERREGTRIG